MQPVSRRRLAATTCALLLLAREGGAVTVSVIGEGGNLRPDSAGEDVVALADSADPTNIAYALGGFGYYNPGAPGGSATAIAFASAADDTAIRASATAEGGIGGPPYWVSGASLGPGFEGGAALASARAIGSGSGDVVVEVSATGGRGGSSDDGSPGGQPGTPSIGYAQGESLGGGNVTVSATLRAGQGGSANLAGEGAAGGDATLQNAVAGLTSGHLSLHQTAIGGEAGYGIAPAATGGSARSELSLGTWSARVDVELVAIGGDGGYTSEAGGAAGVATAEGHIAAYDGAVSLQARAVGGDGGEGGAENSQTADGGEAGSAQVVAYATSMGDGHAVVIGSREAPSDDPYELIPYGAVGGNVGEGYGPLAFPYRGGDALSVSVGVAEGDSEVIVRDRAVGGTGYSASPLSLFGGDGGDAYSRAEGSNAGASAVQVFATARGGVGGISYGDGGIGGHGGVAAASAYGSSTGGGAVTVSAEQIGGGAETSSGDGADSTMLGNVGGETSGLLTLVQRAVGGDGGEFADGTGDTGGDAHSYLDSANSGGGDLALLSEAIGGRGRGTDGRAGSALASARGVTFDDVADVSARAIGGAGAESATGVQGTHGGVAQVGSVEAVGATATDLRARAYAEGGNGGWAHFANAGAGADASLIDVVSVEGPSFERQTLEQTAVGGRGGYAWYSGDGGDGGDASSSLTLNDGLGGSIETGITAIGGDAGSADTYYYGSGGRGGEGGDADAYAMVFATDSPGVSMRTRAIGGDGGTGGTSGGDGGDATLRAVGETFAPWAPVFVGLLDLGDVEQDGARGGDGGSAGYTLSSVAAGRGGHADSASSGYAWGGADVWVVDRARGGNGGYYASDEPGAAGGTATSSAFGESLGESTVSVISQAFGGMGGQAYPGLPGSGGDANATSRALGFGRSTAIAMAEAGASYRFDGYGTAQAFAESRGAGAYSQARAMTGSANSEQWSANAQTSGSAASQSFAWAGFGVDASDPMPGTTSFTGVARPLAADVDDVFLPDSSVRRALDGDALVLGTFALGGSLAAPGDLVSSLSSFYYKAWFDEDVDFGLGLTGGELLDLDSGFEWLGFSVTTTDLTPLFEREFVDPEEAAAFFADQVLLLPDLRSDYGDVELVVSVLMESRSPGTTFEASVLFSTVPEPSVVALLACLALVLAARTRRRYPR